MTDALVVQVDVACSASHAFDTWTRHIDSWWPKGHSTSGDPATTVAIEPHVGGRIYEVTTAGDEIDWGEIEVWDPPNRLVYLWHIATDRADATTIDVTFTPTADGTEVRVEHRGWERLGVSAAERRAGNERGWAAVLPHFVAACAN